MGVIERRTIVYLAKLVLAGLVGAFSLIGNSVEGCIATMLISPLGLLISPIAPALISGKFVRALSACVGLAVSSGVLVGVGAVVRAYDTSKTPKPATNEMSKRTAPLNLTNTIIYAMMIGVISTLNDMPTKIPMSSSSNTRILQNVGLSIAISITVPLINAGIVLVDRMRARPASLRAERTAAAVRSALLAACNIAGVVVSGVAVSIAI